MRLVLVGGLGFSLPEDEASSEVPARLSSSSRRFLSFLPVVETFSQPAIPLTDSPGVLARLHTVVALSNAVLYPPALGKVRDLGPVLVGVGGAAEGAAGAVVGVVPRGLRDWLSRVGIRVL